MKPRSGKPTVHAVHVIGGAVAVVFDPFAERDGPTNPEPPTGPTLIDSLPVEQQNDFGSYGVDAVGGMDAIYQAFELTGAGAKIESLKVSLKAVGAPDGQIVCGFYTVTGEFPTVIPQGSWLRQTGYLDMAEISPDGGLYEFEFVLKPSMGPGKYAVSVERAGNFGPAGASVKVGFNFDFEGAGGAAHPGNGGYHNSGGAWGADDMGDMIFYLYGTPL